MWPFKKKQRYTKAVLGTSDSLGAFLQFGNTTAENPSSALNLYESSTAVSIPINKVAEAFASIQPVIELQDGKILTNHPVLDLLRSPSPFYDQRLFMETLGKYFLITNETELVALGGINRPPLELQPISPANVSVVEGTQGVAVSLDVSGNTLTGAYNLELKRNRARYLNGNLRELKQIRGFSTKNNSLLRGQSQLVPAAAEARQHILGNKHNVSLLEKGGRLSYVFHYEEDMDPDNFLETQDRVRENVGGADKAGSIVVSAGGKLKVEEMGTTNKDMDYVKMQRTAMDSVALQYNVPLPLINTSATTFNNYGTAVLAIYDDAALPLADVIYGGLSQFLLPRYGMDPAKARITYNILAITALRARVLAEIKTRGEINVESDNELREIMGREAYEGGDDFYKPANLIPVGTDTETDEPTPTVLRDAPPE